MISLKTWYGIFNCIALGMLLIMISIFYVQMNTMQTEYDTNRLNQVISYAGEAAFMETLNVGDINLNYTDMSNVVLNPTYCLDVFEEMVCLNYGMATSLENKQYIEECIPSALLAANDGYYITLLSEVDTSVDEVIGEEYGFKWSVKLPYTVTHTTTNPATNVMTNDAISVRLNSEKWIKASKATPGSTLSLTYGDSYSDESVKGILTRKIVQRNINSTLTNALARNIDLVSSIRGDVNYNIYLPASQTSSGINDITGPSLIILLQGADFSAQAKVEEAVISGLRAVRKVHVVGFTDIDGKKRYCYEGQLPEELRGTIESFFNSVEEAARCGYLPSYTYITNKIEL